MAPRLETIRKKIEAARKYIAAGQPAGADKILVSLLERLSGSSRPKAPNQYALFVKHQYKKISAANPSKDAPEIMKLIAQEWRATHGERPRKSSKGMVRGMAAAAA